MADLLTGLLSSMIALCVPLLIAAEGEVFVERSGQFNMGIEGIMAVSALAAFAVTLATGSLLWGFLAGAAIGALSALLIYLLIARLQLNGVLVAIVFNLLASGLTGFLSTFFINNNSVPKQSVHLTQLPIPVLSGIPWIGPILFSQNAAVYIALLSVPALAYVLFHTKFGLQLRATGGNAVAAQTMGIDTYQTKLRCFLIGGASGGLAGAYLSLSLGMFVENITMNKGFIALALCTFSRASPYGTLFGALLFALADSLQLRLQVFKMNIPYEFLLMLPYIMTIVVLVITAGRGERPPAGRRRRNPLPLRRRLHENSK